MADRADLAAALPDLPYVILAKGKAQGLAALPDAEALRRTADAVLRPDGSAEPGVAGSPVANALATPTQTASLSLAGVGISGPSYACNYLAGTGALVSGGGSVSATVTSGTYWIVAPAGPSGITFVGDAGKLVAYGDKRIQNLSDDGAVHATVDFAAGEGPVTLYGHAPRWPTASASASSQATVTITP